MDWSKGYKASYYMARVDPVTWRDVETIQIIDGSISRNDSGLLQSADVTCRNFDQSREIYVRIWMNTQQDGASAHEALFTGLATSPDRDINGRAETHSVACYSVLKPCDDVLLPRGWYAPEGMQGGTIIRQLLSVTPAPVTVADGSPALSGSIIAEDGETRLTMVERILEAIDWRLRISGDGRISVEPKPAEPAATFDPLEYDVIETEISVTADWYECPNVVMAIDGDLTAIARDDSERSPLSTVNRGREVWAMESDCDLAANESIGRYASRRLAELQKFEQTAEYDRRYIPDVMPGDLVLMHYPEQGLEGLYTVSDQKIELGYAARTSETIAKPAALRLAEASET